MSVSFHLFTDEICLDSNSVIVHTVYNILSYLTRMNDETASVYENVHIKKSPICTNSRR